jgi:hypothetical protein
MVGYSRKSKKEDLLCHPLTILLYNEEIMLHRTEEAAIHRGIDEIFFNLRHLDIEDVTISSCKIRSYTSDKLASAIEHNFLKRT